MGQWYRYNPYERVPIHNNSGLPSRRFDHAPRWVTAAITISVARLARNIPPRNRKGSAPLGVARYTLQHIQPKYTRAISASTSNHRPFDRSGPRTMAKGRHTMAKAAPNRIPLSRLTVPRYRVSILLIGRSPSHQ